jgi:hypothetical protein
LNHPLCWHRIWRLGANQASTCGKNNADHRTTKAKRWNGQVEQMNRTIKDASGSTLPSHRRLRLACNFGLKTLAPYEFVREAWAAQP